MKNEKQKNYMGETVDEQQQRYKAIDKYNRLFMLTGKTNLKESDGDLINIDGVY